MQSRPSVTDRRITAAGATAGAASARRTLPARVSLVLGLFSTLLFLAACTDNPFEDSASVAAAPRRITGSVRLSDRADHAGVHIWLEGFDLHTESAADGSFAITLPPASAQGAPGGTDGVFTLHAVLGNYRPRSIPTAVRGGVFTFPTDEIDVEGQLREPLSMQQQFSIRTTLSRDRIEADSLRSITLTVTLESPVPPVGIFFPRMIGGMEGPVLLRDMHTDAVELFETVITSNATSDIVWIEPTGHTRTMILIIPRGRLGAGEYEVVPFLLPRNATVPPALIASLGDDITAPGPAYFRYPLLRDGGRLIVDPN